MAAQGGFKSGPGGNGGPSRAQGTCRRVYDNLVKLDAFFARHPDLFDRRASDENCMAFPRDKGSDGAKVFARRPFRENCALLLPHCIFPSDLTVTPRDRFRIGFGRSGIDEGPAAMETYLPRNSA